jgi:hypothetical protein
MRVVRQQAWRERSRAIDLNRHRPDTFMLMGVLYLLCGGAPPTQDVAPVASVARDLGWDVWVVPTPQAVGFLDLDAVEAVTGHPARSAFRLPGEDRLPPPDAVLAAPLTYNSLNKWAVGIADTFALGVLAEAIGDGRPVVAVPWAKPSLTCHPAFGRSVELMRSLGVVVVEGRDSAPFPPDGASPGFPWKTALAALPPFA